MFTSSQLGIIIFRDYHLGIDRLLSKEYPQELRVFKTHRKKN